MNVPGYADYKDSGLPWLGAVPSHWITSKIKHTYKFTTGWTPPSGRDEYYGGDNLWANISDIGKKFLGDTAKRISDLAVRECNMEPSPEGSLLFSFKLSIGQMSFATVPMFTNEAIASFQPDAVYSLQFAYYAFPIYIVANASENIYGAKMLNQELIKSAPICMPPLNEQTSIAAFLDRETAKIDALVAEQERLIALLKEKRQAVISHAVTKGLNPNTPMKDSGIEWLGEIPAHWAVAPLKRIAIVLAGYAFSAAEFSADGENWRLLRGINLSAGGIRWNEDTVFWQREANDGLENWELRAGDIVLGMDRPWIGDGLRVAEVTEGDLPCLLLQRVAAIRSYSGEANRFILQCLRHEAFFHHCAPEMTGVSVPHISGGQIETFQIPVPPEDEMSAIAKYVVARSQGFELLVDEAQSAITLLQERRAALISAAVTGKIDVRGVVEPVREHELT